MGAAAAKKPQDRKRKKSPAEKLRDEVRATSGIDDLAGRAFTIETRQGPITVTTLPDPLDWDASLMSDLRDGDWLAVVVGMLSTEDGARLKAARPPLRAMMDVVMGNLDDEDEPEPSLGESQAS